MQADWLSAISTGIQIQEQAISVKIRLSQRVVLIWLMFIAQVIAQVEPESGEFGPPEAYQFGSPHPYYGSENEWNRRFFSEERADLYDKRRGQRQVLAILDGSPAAALEMADKRLQADPTAMESLFVKTIALAQLGKLDEAWATMQLGLSAGLPFERFLAGPRDLLAPLTESKKFIALAERHSVALIHGPMLGAVTESSAQFWVRSASETEFEILLISGASRFKAIGKTTIANDYTGVAIVDGLSPDTEYSYSVSAKGKGQPVTQLFTFRTFPKNNSSGRFQIGFGGCAGYTPQNERMWDTIASHNLRAFLLLGDNVYIDLPEMPGAMHDYTYYRRQSRPEFRRLVASTAMYAIWDDHDAAVDDIWMGPYVDRPAWKQPMLDLFRRNWVNPAYGTTGNPGTWFKFSYGDIEFFMLDGRTYRTNPFQAERTMLGPEQKAWLLDGLKKSQATFKVIASPVAWADGAKPGSKDTWAGFAPEREEIFKYIEDNRITGALLLSSDRHRSEAWKIDRDSGYEFYDLLSGQLTNVHTHPVEKGALFSYNDKDSFGLLSFDTSLSDPEVTYQIYSIDNELIETLVIHLSQLATNKRE